MMTRRYFPKAFALTLVMLGLGGCSYTVESSNQNISFMTPGAENAICDVYVEKIRYQVFPPQKINIKKSPKDMDVNCEAPGNRVLDLTVESKFSGRSLWGGPPGMAWDYASSSLFYYPSVIAVDFTAVKPIPNAPPKHNSPDIDQPESYYMEEIKASTPALNSDRSKEKIPLLRREDVMDQDEQDAIEEGAPAANSDKGSLMSILDRLNKKPADTSLPAKNTGSVPPIEGAVSSTAPVQAVDDPIHLEP